MRMVLAAVVTAAVALAAVEPAVAEDIPPGDDVVITTTADEVTYDDEALADEDTTTVEGTLRLAFVETLGPRGEPEVDVDYAIVTDRGATVPIEPAEDLPPEAANGAIAAEVVDGASGDAPLAEATVDTAPAAAATSSSPHRAYVVRVEKTGALPAAGELTTELQTGVLDEWVAEAGGAISSFTVAGVATLPTARTSQTASSLCAMDAVDRVWDEAGDLFPTVSFDATSGNHLVVLTSQDCRLRSSVGIGIGTVGSSIASGGLVSLLWDADLVQSTGFHELGHNVGLLHANAKACATCAVREYYDLFSVMGFSVARTDPPALDTPMRDHLRLVQPGEVATVARTGTSASTTSTRLKPRGAATGVRGLKVVDPVSRQVYWVENRAGGGADGDRDTGSVYDPSYVAVPFHFAPGVTVATMNPDGSLDLLAHEAGSIDEGSLRSGQAWTSPTRGVSVTVGETQVGGPADVTVAFAGSGGTFSAPTPSIRGTRKVGSLLTALHGTWSPEPTTFRYQWYVGSTAISGATGKTYRPGASRAGKTIKVRIQGVRSGYTTKTLYSPSTSALAKGTFSAPAPRIRGTRKVGSLLTALHGTWSPTPSSYRYQWYVGSTAIRGATGKTYRPGASRAGKKIRVRIQGVKSGYTTRTLYSPYTATLKR